MQIKKQHDVAGFVASRLKQDVGNVRYSAHRAGAIGALDNFIDDCGFAASGNDRVYKFIVHGEAKSQRLNRLS